MSLPVLIAAWPAWLATAAPWLAIGLTTLVLGVALRTRWKRTPILTRCVVLSLYAHLLFATVAYTTNFMAWRHGAFGSGSGAREVRVRMASEASPVDAQPEDARQPEPWEPIGEVPTELALVRSDNIKKQDADETPQPKEQPEIPQLPDRRR